MERSVDTLQEIVPIDQNFKMLVGSRHYDHYLNNAFENFTSDLIYNHLQSGTLFIDIGAHYGYYTLLAGTKYPENKIIAFEPEPSNYDLLKKNIEMNKLTNVDIYNLAVSNEEGIKEFAVAEHSSRSGFYEPYLSNILKKINVKTVLIDNVVKDDIPLKIMIKIDAEGHEIFIIEGMRKLLESTKDVELFIEYNPDMIKKSGNRPEKLLETLNQCGFDIYIIDDERRLTFKLDGLKNYQRYFDDHNFNKNYCNLLCIKSERSLNLCIFSHSSMLAGSERGLLELTAGLINEYQALCTIILPSDGPLKKKLEDVGASTIIIDYDWWCGWKLPTAEELNCVFLNSYNSVDDQLDTIKKINPDVVITNTMVIPWGAVAALDINKPHIWYVHEFGRLDHGLEFYVPFDKVIDYIKASNFIFTNSNIVKSTLFGDVNNVTTIYYDINIQPETVTNDADGYFTNEGALRLIITGHITASKGQKDAVLAVKELVSQNQNVELIVLGPSQPEYLEELKVLIRSNGLEQYVKFHDFNENPYPIVNQADIVLMCSRNEAFGRVVLEAMRLKKPVIGTRSGATPEMVIEGFNGLLYKPGDYQQLAHKIKFFIENRDKVKEFGENGQNYVRDNFTRDNFISKTYRYMIGLKGQTIHVLSSEPAMAKRLLEFTLWAKKLENEGNKKIITELEAQVQAIGQELNDKVSRSNTEISKLENDRQQLSALNSNLEKELASIKGSFIWRLLMVYQRMVDIVLPPETRRGRVYGLGLKAIHILMISGLGALWLSSRNYLKARYGSDSYNSTYEKWIGQNEPLNNQLAANAEESKKFSYRPLISIIMPVWNTDKRWLCRAIESVMHQSYDCWELCIADGGSTKPHVSEVLRNYTKMDSRIKVKFLDGNRGIAENSNEALSMATGDFIGLLDHDDELAPFALYEVVRLLNKNPVLDFIYSDEDKIGTGDKRWDPFFKPGWSPDFLLACGYTNHLSIYRKKIIDTLGGFRKDFDGSQDYDLLLRFTESIPQENIAHIPKVLYHWRQIAGSTSMDPHAKNSVVINMAKKALEDTLQRRNIKGSVVDGLWPSSYHVKRDIIGNPLVTIIIPTKDKLKLLKNCVDSIEQKSTYRYREIIIVDNNSIEPETLEYLNRCPHKVLRYSETFNFSKINNFAVKHASGDYIIFLNNDTEVVTPDWIEALLEQAQIQEIGAVGCKLLYPGGTIQHAGVVLGMSPDQTTGIAGHVFKGLSYEDNGYFGAINVIKNYSAVTAACMMMSRKAYDAVEGFDEKLAVCYNDVDLCLRLHEKGYHIVYTPYAELFHYESESRGCSVDINEAQYMMERWGALIKNDPYHSPNLTLMKYNCELNLP